VPCNFIDVILVRVLQTVIARSTLLSEREVPLALLPKSHTSAM
jgi:hypothetical protein